MNKRKFFPTLVILLTLVSTVFLTACGTVGPVPAKAASFEDDAGKKMLTQFDPGEAAAYRWYAMAKAYEKIELPIEPLLTDYAPDDILAYRWNAMAKAYEKIELPIEPLLTDYAPDDILAYRWNAMAQEYQRLGLIGE